MFSFSLQLHWLQNTSLNEPERSGPGSQGAPRTEPGTLNPETVMHLFFFFGEAKKKLFHVRTPDVFQMREQSGTWKADRVRPRTHDHLCTERDARQRSNQGDGGEKKQFGI